MEKKIIAIVACDNAKAIGFKGELLWKQDQLLSDISNFRRMTLGCPVIMGRKTFESLPLRSYGEDKKSRHLPNRYNIVITHDPDTYKKTLLDVYGLNVEEMKQELVIVSSIEEALECVDDVNYIKVFIIGGESIYRASLPYINRIYMTVVDHVFENSDTHFPSDDEIEANGLYVDENLLDKPVTYKGETDMYATKFVVYRRP